VGLVRKALKTGGRGEKICKRVSGPAGLKGAIRPRAPPPPNQYGKRNETDYRYTSDLDNNGCGGGGGGGAHTNDSTSKVMEKYV